ncbi:MAG: restriction endonuclease subunit S [Nitrospirae bacterium]|nr:restriction endonuclease subunit S [Nitrospirota bacterium]
MKSSTKFLFYLSRSEKMVNRIMALSKGVSYPAIDSEDIKNLECCLPPLVEQHEIVAHIQQETAKLDALKAAAERTIGLLKERRAALIAEAVTGKIQPSLTIAENSDN